MIGFPQFFIAAPFGNYITHEGAISVKGTFTYRPNGNRVWSVLKSLRYNYANKGWTNKLGLPNPGIYAGLKNTTRADIISIAELQRGDFKHLHDTIPYNQSVELNLSCPNLDKTLPWDNIHIFTKDKEREWCIAKLSPLTRPEEIEYLYTKGFRQLHFSNTLPMTQFDRYSRAGGLSGKTLKPYTLKLIEITRQDFPRDIEIIAGGGVETEQDVWDYMDAGCDHVSIGTLCFRPFSMRRLLRGW